MGMYRYSIFRSIGDNAPCGSHFHIIAMQFRPIGESYLLVAIPDFCVFLGKRREHDVTSRFRNPVDDNRPLGQDIEVACVSSIAKVDIAYRDVDIVVNVGKVGNFDRNFAINDIVDVDVFASANLQGVHSFEIGSVIHGIGFYLNRLSEKTHIFDVELRAGDLHAAFE